MRPMAGKISSCVKVSPVLVCKLSVIACSRGSELSITNGIRSGLPATP